MGFLVPSTYKRVERKLYYAPLPVGSAQLLLPQRAVLTETLSNNDVNQTEVRFKDCRQYIAESVVHFDAPEVLDLRGKRSLQLPQEFETEVARRARSIPIPPQSVIPLQRE
jgi:hypothetical protein